LCFHALHCDRTSGNGKPLGLQGGHVGHGLVPVVEPSDHGGDTQPTRDRSVAEHRPLGPIIGVPAVLKGESDLLIHGVDYTGASENGKRLAIGNSNRRRRTDSRGSNAQVWIRAPVLRLL